MPNNHLNVLTGILKSYPYLCQYFFVFPRFRYRPSTQIYIRINKLFNIKNIGDNLKKLNFKRSLSTKIDNGILINNIYEMNCNFELNVDTELIKVPYDFYGDISCETCLYRKNNFCLIWQNDVFKLKYSCDEWEQNIKENEL